MARTTQNKQKALFSLFHCGPSTKNSRNVVVSSGVKDSYNNNNNIGDSNKTNNSNNKIMIISIAVVIMLLLVMVS